MSVGGSRCIVWILVRFVNCYAERRCAQVRVAFPYSTRTKFCDCSLWLCYKHTGNSDAFALLSNLKWIPYTQASFVSKDFGLLGCDAVMSGTTHPTIKCHILEDPNLSLCLTTIPWIRVRGGTASRSGLSGPGETTTLVILLISKYEKCFDISNLLSIMLF